jgi:hypothetical protein
VAHRGIVTEPNFVALPARHPLRHRVLAALALGFLGTLVLRRGHIRAQETQAPSPAADEEAAV